MASPDAPQELILGALHDETRESLDVEQGRLLFARETTFLKGVVNLDGLPDIGLPEIAFAGRSNVGKSSLVNALTGRKTLARTSNTPGRTQELNFFSLDDRLMLVDLPGYGFAKTSKDKVRNWEKMVRAYLRGRVELRRVLLLVDARHGLKESDRTLMKMLDESAVSYQAVLTKADKLKRGEIETVLRRTKNDLQKHVAAHPDLALTSSEKGWGIPELRAQIAALALEAPAGL